MQFVIRKSQPTYTEVHVDGPLTTISVAFAQSATGMAGRASMGVAWVIGGP